MTTQPDIDTLVLGHLRSENVWASLDTLLGAVNVERRRARQRTWKADDLMNALGRLVASGDVMYEFHHGDCVYTHHPGRTQEALR